MVGTSNGNGSTKIPCLMVAAGQAIGGIAAQFIGPEIYGGSADWTSILASHGAGFVVGVSNLWNSQDEL